MANLSDLLKTLGSDADLATAYEKNPEAVMANYQLSSEEKQAMLSGNVETVRRCCGLQSLNMTNGTIKSHEAD